MQTRMIHSRVIPSTFDVANGNLLWQYESKHRQLLRLLLLRLAPCNGLSEGNKIATGIVFPIVALLAVFTALWALRRLKINQAYSGHEKTEIDAGSKPHPVGELS